MQKPILTVLLLIIGLFAITIKNNTPENSSNTSVIVLPMSENNANIVDEEFVNDINQDLNNVESTTTDSLASTTMEMN